MNYLQLSQHAIKTYSETVDSAAIKKEIAAAQKMVFLGFAYHDQNMRLLSRDDHLKPIPMIGTARGMSLSDITVVQEQLSQWVDPRLRHALPDSNIDIDATLTAAQLFDAYSKSI